MALPRSPTLILCSEDDRIAPAWRIRKFAAALAARCGGGLREDTPGHSAAGAEATAAPPAISPDDIPGRLDAAAVGASSGESGAAAAGAAFPASAAPAAFAPPQHPRVRLVCWGSSEHVGHFRRHPPEYEAAVASLLRGAAGAFAAAHGLLPAPGAFDGVLAPGAAFTDRDSGAAGGGAQYLVPGATAIEGVVAPGAGAARDGRGVGSYLLPSGGGGASQAESLLAAGLRASPPPPLPPPAHAIARAAQANKQPFRPSALEGVLPPGGAGGGGGGGARAGGAGGDASYLLPPGTAAPAAEGVVAPGGGSARDGRGAGGYLVPPLSPEAAQAMLTAPAVHHPSSSSASQPNHNKPFSASSLDGVLAPGAGARRDGAGVSPYLVPGADAASAELSGVVLPGAGTQLDGRGVSGYLVPGGAVPATSAEAARQLVAAGAARLAPPPPPKRLPAGSESGREFAKALIAEGEKELLESATAAEAEAHARLSAVAGGSTAVGEAAAGATTSADDNAENAGQQQGNSSSTQAVMRGLLTSRL